MKIHINDILPMARKGIILAYNRSELARSEHFHEWLERLMKDDPHPAFKMHEWVMAVPLDGLSDDERAEIVLARLLTAFASDFAMEPEIFELGHSWRLCLRDLSPHLPRPQDGAFIWQEEYHSRPKPWQMEDAR